MGWAITRLLLLWGIFDNGGVLFFGVYEVKKNGGKRSHFKAVLQQRYNVRYLVPITWYIDTPMANKAIMIW